MMEMGIPPPPKKKERKKSLDGRNDRELNEYHVWILYCPVFSNQIKLEVVHHL